MQPSLKNMVTTLVKIVLPILRITMLQQGCFNRKPNFKCDSFSYKQVTEHTIFCYVDNAFVYILNVKVVKIPVLNLK